MLGIGGYYFKKDNAREFSYLENSSNRNELASAFHVIEEKRKSTRFPSSVLQEKVTPMKNEILADSSYEAFLDKKNANHILLSKKIVNREPIVELEYSKEIELILTSGNFDQHVQEEVFLIEEIAKQKNSLAVDLLEIKLGRIISNLNENENDDNSEKHFKYLLSLYIAKLNEGSMDIEERRKAIEEQITSPRLKKILLTYWEISTNVNDESL